VAGERYVKNGLTWHLLSPRSGRCRRAP